MQTSIFISGQIGGNFRLKAAIQTNDCEVSEAMFNGFRLTFKTKKEAEKALWEGFKYLRIGENNPHNFRYFPKKSIIYDASRAELEQHLKRTS